jgi:hypothetical protein
LEPPPKLAAVPVEVTFALVGDPRPVGSTNYSADDLAIPWDERRKVTLVVDEGESLGAALARAGEQFGLTVAWDQPLAESFAWVGFYRPEHERGEAVRNLSSVTLADSQGRAFWNVYFRDVTFGELLLAAEAGALEGDPRRIYVFTWPGFGNGIIANFDILGNFWDLAWYVMERIGVGYAAYEALRRVRDRLRRGREVTALHQRDWQERGGDPGTLSEFLRHRPSTSAEVARFLGCTEEEAEAALWAFGFAPDEDTGRWKPNATEDAKMLRAVWELIVYGYNDVELERRFREEAEAFAATGRAREIDWMEEPRRDAD